MKFEVDLDKCMNHGQCSYAAPTLFSMNERGQLSLRDEAEAVYQSADVKSTADQEALEDAADGCPVQAIRVLQDQ